MAGVKGLYREAVGVSVGARSTSRRSRAAPVYAVERDATPAWTEPLIPARTIAAVVDHIAPGFSWSWLSQWPPDVFAATSVILGDSGAYRSLVDPPPELSWPPSDAAPNGEDWQTWVRRCGLEWATWAADAPRSDGPGAGPPAEVAGVVRTIDAAANTPLTELDAPRYWDVLVAILTLHAMADEACSGVGLVRDGPFQTIAVERLASTCSLSRLPTDRVRVLPKLRAPETGITLRSLSHHLALDRSEVHTQWLLPPPPVGDQVVPRSRLTLLLVPFPKVVHASDFRPVPGPLKNMDERRFGFYEYDPAERISPDEIVSLAESARRRLGAVDGVVLPEGALDLETALTLRRSLAEADVPCLITGVRRAATKRAPFGANYAYIGGPGWQATQQKHHRWCLDEAQVHQYHLGAALDPDVRWWEAIAIQKRTLTFVTPPGCGCLTVCPLVCEDLARPDPVADVVRAVAPTLVVGLLLDGPQLSSRWPARYASVLADDPGCSVLTLTALGMAWRSQPPGAAPSRVVALWKDHHRGLQQITLAEGARAVALTAHRREVSVTTADGRTSARPVTELVLSGIEQIA